MVSENKTRYESPFSWLSFLLVFLWEKEEEEEGKTEKQRKIGWRRIKKFAQEAYVWPLRSSFGHLLAQSFGVCGLVYGPDPFKTYSWPHLLA
jgi:hypothetical protein